LLNPDRPPVLPVILRVPTSGKSQLAPALEEFVQEENDSDSETKSVCRVSQPVVSPRKLKVRREKAPEEEESTRSVFAYSTVRGML